MKRAFKLEGLDCAVCASKIESAVQSLDGVAFVTVSSVTGKMVIEGNAMKFDKIVSKARNIIKKIEPSIVMKHL